MGWSGAILGLIVGITMSMILIADAAVHCAQKVHGALATAEIQASALSAAIADVDRNLRPLIRQLRRLPSTPSPAAPPATPSPIAPRASTRVETAPSLASPPIMTTVVLPRSAILGGDGTELPHNGRILHTRRGIRIHAVRPRSLWARLGLANGDLIERIDGDQLHSPERALAIYNRLRKKRSFTIELVRSGLPHSIAVRFVDRTRPRAL